MSQTTISATIARAKGVQSIEQRIAACPSVETATTDQITAFIAAMERIPA